MRKDVLQEHLVDQLGGAGLLLLGLELSLPLIVKSMHVFVLMREHRVVIKVPHVTTLGDGHEPRSHIHTCRSMTKKNKEQMVR